MSPRMKGLRILIAEDHEVIRRGIRSMLEDRSEWRVCGEAATVAETIQRTRTLQPDLVLLDVTMPDMEAAEAIPHILNVCPTVKIVALAMLESAELAANALAAGANGLALKSEPASDLVLTVQNTINNQPFLSPAAVTMIQSQLGRLRTTAVTPAGLTPRELEILEALAKGRSNKELARTLGISVKTVSAHRTNIMRKLKLRNYSSLVQFAIRNGVIDG